MASALATPVAARSLGPVSATGYAYDDIYLEHVLYDDHPESPERLVGINAYLDLTGLSELLVPLTSLQDGEDHILSVHNAYHHDSVQACPGTAAAALYAVEHILGVVDAVHAGTVRNAFCAVRPPGHHCHNNGANYDGTCQGEGFCFYNNVAVAARYAQHLGYANVLICDWDYHHGNGTEWSFYDDPSVFYFSTHVLNAYPGTGYADRMGAGDGEGYNLNVPLEVGAGDVEASRAWDVDLNDALSRVGFVPDIVFISAGFDSRGGDPLGSLSFTDEGFASLTAKAMAIADTCCQGRLVSCLEGGYHVEGLARAVCAHVATLAGLDWQDYIPRLALTPRPARRDHARPVLRDGLLALPATCAANGCLVRVCTLSGRCAWSQRIPAGHGRVKDLRQALHTTQLGVVEVRTADGRTLVAADHF